MTQQKPMKIPGPDHPITIAANPARVTVSLGDRIVADTIRAVTLQEASYQPVLYIPREDADMALLQPTDHVTYCPYKGECSYFSIPSGGPSLANAVWSYEAPYDAVAQIKGYLAFYPDRGASVTVAPR
ncbi:MAG TPA: DUF427 domain-containing protein [Stellaceae bacterium]|jgi:uncharacterized protein (DUF427 family)|nr:DUF427 domain-containing protein [Stellaceae bacterium]